MTDGTMTIGNQVGATSTTEEEATTLLVLEIVIRRRAGTAAATSVCAARVWPATFRSALGSTLLVLWTLPMLLLPGR
jgi:hypothetical protein